ncbi:MAG: hypothetical protein M3386_03255 [Actinomycetota bacterium]|jgi:hypothetical protein|nr:hypothetical protein [Nocardioidaceae bacterium]MDQ3591901.1 hypothetical protein [Actinomycetota bacterium]
MHGLTVRWSLVAAQPDALSQLRDYVETQSYERFSGKEGLGFKTWRAREGEWFEGCYVFASSADREAFQDEFTSGADDAPASRIVGSPPVLIEPCEVVAVVEGGAGFRAAPSYR